MTVVGLQWVQSTNVFTRLGALSGMTVPQAIAYLNGLDPWMSAGRCNVWNNGTLTASHGDRCYTDTDVANMGQVMVKFKKFWYCVDFSAAGIWRWYISDTGADSVPSGVVGGWKVHPMFASGAYTNDVVYVGAYEGYYNPSTAMLESKAGVMPKGSANIDTFRAWAQAQGSGWGILTYNANAALQLMALIAYGTNAIPFTGITNLGAETHRTVGGYDGDTSTGCLTGHTGSTGTDLGNVSGEVVFTTDAANGLNALDSPTVTQAMSLFGVENWFGNYDKWLDGINIATYVPYIATSGFAENKFTDTYVTTGYTANLNWDVGIIPHSAGTFDYTFIPVDRSGGNYFTGYSITLSAVYMLSVGGDWLSTIGPFCWNAAHPDAPTWLNANNARLMYAAHNG